MERNVARGDLVATTQLALYHRDGTMGLPVDLAGAAALYAKAARGGHVGAMVDLGAGRGRDIGQLQRRLSRSFSTRFGSFFDERSSLGAISNVNVFLLERARAERPP